MNANTTIIFGTHKLPKEAVQYALKCGINMLDTATGYNNADMIGGILQENNHQTYITTKFNSNDFEKNIEFVASEHIKSLSQNHKLHSALLHSKLITNEDNVIALLQLRKLFPNSYIGVSNFDIESIQYLIDNGCKPDIISIEFHPYYQPLKLVHFCINNNITLTGYRTFAKGSIFNDKCLNEIANKHNRLVMDVVLSWSLKSNVIPTVSSSKEENINKLANFIKSDKLFLDQDDMNRIGELNKGKLGSSCMIKFCKHDE